MADIIQIGRSVNNTVGYKLDLVEQLIADTDLDLAVWDYWMRQAFDAKGWTIHDVAYRYSRYKEGKLWIDPLLDPCIPRISRKEGSLCPA